jgi:nucleoside phosphorylase
VPMKGGRYGHTRVAVLSVIEEETAAVHEVFGLTERIPGRPYFVTPGADITRPDVVNREVGRNNTVSLDRIREVIEHWRPELLVLCGIAGGISGREGVKLGDIVIPEYIHYCSYAKLSEDGTQRRYMPYDHPSLSLHADYAAPLRDDPSWINMAVRELLPDNRIPRVIIGSIVAGDKVYGNSESEEQKQIVAEFDEAVAIDMESVGLCRAVALSRVSPEYNPRLLIVRSISDLVGARQNSRQRALYKPLSAKAAAILTRKLVTDILANEPDPRMPTGDAHER